MLPDDSVPAVGSATRHSKRRVGTGGQQNSVELVVMRVLEAPCDARAASVVRHEGNRDRFEATIQ